ncbi:MAG TPA: LysR substrate-binding domain-containing protein [Allosphingosinicella sp.]|jgi:LysR family glycine cleavage system transcriptional activator|nr:LysR substrate-binding domain-containing protein [Allosphingosinicella sp.]
MRRIPPLTAVRVFEAAARYENFTAAAAELGMTQAAVSYQIRILEERLGLLLFLRSKRRVTLSDAGRKAAPLVANAFDTLADAFAGIVEDDGAVLTISTTQTFASNWMAPRLGAFQFERPELAVRLMTQNQIIDFAREEVDVAIRSGRGPWPGLRQDFLMRVHATPFCSPAFRERHDLHHPQQLLSLPRLNPDDIWWKQWFAAAGIAEAEGPRPPAIRLDSQQMEGNATIAGHGIGMLTPLLWRTEIEAGRLVQLFPLIIYEGPSYWLVSPEQKRNQPKIRAFREWMLGQFAELKQGGPAEAFIAPEGEG